MTQPVTTSIGLPRPTCTPESSFRWAARVAHANSSPIEVMGQPNDQRSPDCGFARTVSPRDRRLS
jgi:hypothetical protein